MPEIGSESAKIIKTLWRAMESEKLDHSVLHQITSLIVKYMSSPLTNDLDEEQSSMRVCALWADITLLSYDMCSMGLCNLLSIFSLSLPLTLVFFNKKQVLSEGSNPKPV